METKDKNQSSKNSEAKKDKATSGGGKDTNPGGTPAKEIKGGKGNTSGSRGTQGK